MKNKMTRRQYLGLTAASIAVPFMSGIPTVAQTAVSRSSVSCLQDKKSFLNRNNPVITALLKAETAGELIAMAAKSESEGAEGIAVELTHLKPEFRNRDSLKSIIDTVHLPFMFCFYRNDKWENHDDDARQEILLAAADAGASMIDVMGDLYDPSPLELTRNSVAVEKQ